MQALYLCGLVRFKFFLHSLYFENVLQEYACTGGGVGGMPKAYFLVQGWVGGSKMADLGRTYFMDGP